MTRIPLHVLTGFLGSGKTTLLNHILRDPTWSDSVVLINEIGAAPIDHDLVERMESTDDLDIVVLKGGCTCCALRGDMVAALRALHARRAAGLVPPFARVLMETTGLADPAPILFTLFGDPLLRYKLERGAVIATLDAVHGLAQLARHPESRRQIAVADHVVLTKRDLAEAVPEPRLSLAIQRLNPAAPVSDVRDAAALVGLLAHPGRDPAFLDRAYDTHKSGPWSGDQHAAGSIRSPRDRVPALAKKLGAVSPDPEQPRFVADAPLADHSADIANVAILLDEPLEWSAFAVWLTLLVHAHGQKLLRFKALLEVAGCTGPVALDAIHHMIHPPRHLQAWPQGPRRSRLVFIAQGLEVGRIEPSLRGFLAGRHAFQPGSAS